MPIQTATNVQEAQQRMVPLPGTTMPTQADFDAALARAQAISDELAERLGAERSYVTIAIHDVPASTYHMLPHQPRHRGGITWKWVVGTQFALHCAHGSDCPDLEPSTGGTAA